MKSVDTTVRALKLLELLKRETDSEHPLSMPNLIAMLEEFGYSADRRTVYRDLSSLKEAGYSISFVRHGHVMGYYLSHFYQPSEIVTILESVQESLSLSKEESNQLNTKLMRELSIHEQTGLKINPSNPSKTDNPDVLKNMEQILSAIRQAHKIKFRYYDYSLNQKRHYRRNSEAYTESPYAIVTDSGRLYVVLYSSRHGSFGAWRIDKMDHVEIVDEQRDEQRFDLKRWMQSSLRMYHGKAETITMECSLSILNQVYDAFGRDILISAVKDQTFTANVQASVTPTLIAWILQFYQSVTVIKPQSLKEELLKIASTLNETYGGNAE